VKLTPDSALHESLAAVERAAVRAKGLSQQLLTFAKGGRPVKGTADVGQVVHEAAVFACHGSVVACEFDAAADLLPAEIDAGQISQVIQNIVVNAVQAMPGGGRIFIEARNDPLKGDNLPGLPEGPYVRIAIRDEGKGIPDKLLEKIFDPYFTTKSAGSGLGLATSRSIVRNHGGSIRVSSAPGKGATFTIHLPASPGKLIRPETEAPIELAGHGSRVLVMDDEEIVRTLAISMLRHLGFSALSAASGEEAIAMFRDAAREGAPFDLAILDVTVAGGMGGKECLAALLSLDPEGRIILSSGYSDDAILSRHKDFGAMAALPKPYGVADLKKALREVFRNHPGPAAR
jgi:CheY-like chemotaxis protein